MVAGFCVSCPESADTAMADMREIGPTYFFAPPRVLEQMLTRVLIRMEDASRLKRGLFHYFLGLARRHGEKLLNGEKVSLTGRALYFGGRVLVYGPLMNALGFSRVRVALTAGEAIGGELFSFYRSLGLNLKQFYGQTEAFLCLTAQPAGEVFPDTVGRVMPNVELRIADDGEVQFKSPGMFVNYFRDPTRTSASMTADGYVKTGDAGFFDPKSGQLKIIDRVSDVGRLTDGTLFAPKYLENKLKFFPNIREVVAFGNGRDFVTVMLNIDLAAVGDWAERHNIAYASYQELAAHPEVYDLVARHVADVNRALADDGMMARIRRFLILHKELDADDGEVTRTQKSAVPLWRNATLRLSTRFTTVRTRPTSRRKLPSRTGARACCRLASISATWRPRCQVRVLHTSRLRVARRRGPHDATGHEPHRRNPPLDRERVAEFRRRQSCRRGFV